MPRKIFPIGLLFLLFATDRLIKIWVVQSFPEGRGITIFDPWLHFTRVNNTGAAFGLWKNSAFFLVVFSLVSFLSIFFYLLKSNQLKHGIAWAMIAGGALGNLYDRIFHGYVIDYVDLRVWPVFNLADAGICVGVFWIIMNFAFTQRAGNKSHAPHSR